MTLPAKSLHEPTRHVDAPAIAITRSHWACNFQARADVAGGVVAASFVAGPCPCARPEFAAQACQACAARHAEDDPADTATTRGHAIAQKTVAVGPHAHAIVASFSCAGALPVLAVQTGEVLAGTNAVALTAHNLVARAPLLASLAASAVAHEELLNSNMHAQQSRREADTVADRHNSRTPVAPDTMKLTRKAPQEHVR